MDRNKKKREGIVASTIKGILCLLLAALIAACGGGDSSDTGSTGNSITSGVVTFNLNLTGLAEVSNDTFTPVAAVTTVITQVSVTLSREGFEDISQDLTVSSNVASGSIGGLEAGYWHVTATVFSEAMPVFEGHADVQVIAGAQVECVILFDPVEPAPLTTGSVTLTVGLNPMPGYRILDQGVDDVQLDAQREVLYLFDKAQGIVAAYDANSLVRTKDIPVPDAPLSFTMDPTSNALLLGFPSGHIYRLDVDTEDLILVAEAMIPIVSLVPFSGAFLFVSDADTMGSGQYTHKTIDIGTGQIASSHTESAWGLASLVAHPSSGTVYGLRDELNPYYIQRYRTNPSTGAIETIDSISYFESGRLGSPLRLIRNGERLVASPGEMYTISPIAQSDLQYAGNLGHAYTDLVSDDTLERLYLLDQDDPRKLLVIDQTTFFVQFTVDLLGEPCRVFSTSSSIVVITKHQGAYYAKSFSKEDLGLLD